jgi:dTDP-4-dehydrorhamnose 3,5-epimerase
MGNLNLKQISITPLKRISNSNGDVYHAIKKSDNGFITFGESYFSFINYNSIKGWKKHTKMIMNLVVPIGNVSFVFYDESLNKFQEISIGVDNYVRLTISPGIWFAFKGKSETPSMVVNFSNIEHNDKEVEKKLLNEFNYNWEI